MAVLFAPRAFTKGSKKQAVADVLEHARPDRDYYVLLVGSILIAIGAIFTDSIPVLIASMILSPLANPILALGLGLAAGNVRLVVRALTLLVLSSIAALGLAAAAVVLFNNDRVPDILISFNGNTAIAVTVAVVCGAIAAYGSMRPKVASAATGVAIAVSLMPPLVATGIGLAPGGTPFSGALALFLLNVVGITLSSAVVFWLMSVGRFARRA